MFSGHYPKYKFPLAARQWLDSRKRLSPTTRKHYEDYIQTLSRFFQMPIEEIKIGHVVVYQRSRQAEIRMSAQHKYRKDGAPPDPSDGASRINHEISCLGQVLARAGLWEEIKKFYEPLPLPADSPAIALDREEEDHLFTLASSKSRWMVAYCCDRITRTTTAGPGEIRHLRIRDIDLESPAGPVVHIREGLKNEFRERPLPLNNDAARAMQFLLERYQRICTRCGITPSADHYLLPHRASKRGEPADPTRPMGSWKRAHYAMRAAAAKKFPRLARLRRYDLRHTACTIMLEDPSIAYTTIEHMMGHRLNSKTKRKYDHLRNQALRAAAVALDRGHAAEASPEPPRKQPARELAALAQIAVNACPALERPPRTAQNLLAAWNLGGSSTTNFFLGPNPKIKGEDE